MNDTIFLTCPKCGKTMAFNMVHHICVCDCGYIYEGDLLIRLKCHSLRCIPKEGDDE